MTKLLKSELSRLFRNKVLYLLPIVLTVLSLTGDGQLSYSHPLYNLSCIAAMALLNIFGFALFRKSDLS